MVECSVTQSVCAAHLSQVVMRGEIWQVSVGAPRWKIWFTDWLADCFTDLLTNYMTDWLILGDELNRFTDWLTDWFTVWLTDRAVTVAEFSILDAGLNPVGEFLLKGINLPITRGSDHRNSQCFVRTPADCEPLLSAPAAGCRQIKQICERDTYFFFFVKPITIKLIQMSRCSRRLFFN